MDIMQKIEQGGNRIIELRQQWRPIIEQDPEYVARGGIVYPYDTIAANLPGLFQLMDEAGFTEKLADGSIRKVADIGCANGELGFAFQQAGFEVTAVDFSYKHDQAPYIVSKIGEHFDMPVTVCDYSIDRYFTVKDLKESVVSSTSALSDDYQFDLIVTLGLLYHLKNPFAYVESLSRMSRYVILGTHVMTHTPQFRYRVDDFPLAYLVDAGELNGDPTNFWILSEKAFERLAERSGFRVLGKLALPNNPLRLAVPDRPEIGVRNFLLLESINV